MPNLVKLTQNEIRDLERKVGNIETYKEEIMRQSRNISRFDVYKDTDSKNRDIYVALKNAPYDNYEQTNDTLY